jgi:hypothetical protein
VPDDEVTYFFSVINLAPEYHLSFLNYSLLRTLPLLLQRSEVPTGQSITQLPQRRHTSAAMPHLSRTWPQAVHAHYGTISTINLIRKLGELTFLTRIFIRNNVISTYPLEILAMYGIEQKWRENTPLNPRQKLSINQNAPVSLIWIKGPTRTCN